MAIFNSYVSLPEGMIPYCQGKIAPSLRRQEPVEGAASNSINFVGKQT